MTGHWDRREDVVFGKSRVELIDAIWRVCNKNPKEKGRKNGQDKQLWSLLVMAIGQDRLTVGQSLERR